MSFVYLGGEGGVKPTYFEVYAADKLVPSLRAAVIYSLSVFGQRRAWVQRLLDREDEVYAVIALLLNRHSLRNLDATFAESLYGLKREGAAEQAQRTVQQEAAARRAAAQPGEPAAAPLPPLRLSRGQYRAALLCEVLLPYLQSKAHKLYTANAPRPGVLGLAVSRAAALQAQPPPEASPLRRLLWRLHAAALPAFVAAYPYLHAATEAARFAYQLCFLLGAAPVHSPVLQLLGQRLVRVSGPELAQLERDKQRKRSQQLHAAAARRPAPLAWLSAGWLRAGHAVSDHMRHALILSVFAFKILEWWYTSAEERLAASAALPPPPPPKAPLPDPGGVALPDDPALCPLCRRKRVNPAAISVSGYVFCYPCAFNWVTEQRCCPVTRFPASLDHIRKLYEAT